MKQKHLFILMMVMALSPLSSLRVSANPVDINLQAGYIDPNLNQDDQRSPVLVPQVGIENNTLTFYTPCDGCTLQLVDEDGIVVYTTVIPSGATNLVLPSYLSGDYEIQIVRGNFYFYGYINL